MFKTDLKEIKKRNIELEGESFDASESNQAKLIASFEELNDKNRKMQKHKEKHAAMKRNLNKLNKFKKYGINYNNLNKIVKEYKTKGFHIELEQIKNLFNKSVLTAEGYAAIVDEAKGNKTEVKKINSDSKYLDKLSEIMHERTVNGASQLKVSYEEPKESQEESRSMREIVKNIRFHSKYNSALKDTLASVDFANMNTAEDENSSVRKGSLALKNNKIEKVHAKKSAATSKNIFKCTTTNENVPEVQLPPVDRKKTVAPMRKLQTIRHQEDDLNMKDSTIDKKVNYYLMKSKTIQVAKETFLGHIYEKAKSSSLAQGELESDILAYFRGMTSREVNNLGSYDRE